MSRAHAPSQDCHTFDCWQFTPEGAAIHIEDRIAVIADLHLGYEWARAAAGDCVPPHSLNETITRLTRLLARGPISQLIVAGDLVESSRPCRRTAADVTSLAQWLADREISLVVLEGNHDFGLLAHAPERVRIPLAGMRPALTLDGWTISHGHLPSTDARTMTGHHHPVLRVSGVAAPCFLASADQIVLPAFSCNAAGCDIRTAQLPDDWPLLAFQCFVSTGTEVLDFGPLTKLRKISAPFA